jgi:hypothetical protein
MHYPSNKHLEIGKAMKKASCHPPIHPIDSGGGLILVMTDVAGMSKFNLFHLATTEIW